MLGLFCLVSLETVPHSTQVSITYYLNFPPSAYPLSSLTVGDAHDLPNTIFDI